jgi:uncharacterized membrane protein YhaH (DUF805 family)
LPVPKSLRNQFSSAGTLSQQAFVLAATAVYAAGILAQLLTAPAVVARAGLWPFALAQPILTWAWFAIHAKRLRDAGRAVGPAAGIAMLYLLSVVLLLMVAASFVNTSVAHGEEAMAANAVVLLLSILAVLFVSPDYGLVWIIVTVLILIACAPVVIALGFSLWAATRPSAREQPP